MLDASESRRGRVQAQRLWRQWRQAHGDTPYCVIFIITRLGTSDDSSTDIYIMTRIFGVEHASCTPLLRRDQCESLMGSGLSETLASRAVAPTPILSILLQGHERCCTGWLWDCAGRS